MRRFANLYLILFILDAALSVADEVVALVSGVHALAFARNPVALSVVFLSLPMVFFMLMDRRIPKRLFIPLTLFALWGSTGFFPLAFPEVPKGLSFGASGAQLLFALAAMAWVKKTSSHPLFLSNDHFTGPWFSWKSSLLYAAGAAVVVPVFALAVLLSSVPALVESGTAGFMKLTGEGLVMVEKEYAGRDKTIRLVPMIHIGESDFYDGVSGVLTGGDTVILAEGVSDRENRLKGAFNYKDISRLLGLSSQNEMRVDAQLITREELTQTNDGSNAQGKADLIQADVDIASFSPETIDFLVTLTSAFFTGKPFGEAYAQYDSWVKTHEAPDRLMATVKHDLIGLRNEFLVGVLKEAMPRYTTLVVPWGALHMPGIEKEVKRMGFIKVSETQRVSIPLDGMAERFQALLPQEIEETP